jgi:chloramphenicol 3-O phosphotransferase
MALGTVILLNGTSSAGKTSLARAIQDVMDEPYLVLGIDIFLEQFPERYLGERGPHREATPTEREGVVFVCTEPDGRGFRGLEIGPWGRALGAGLRHAAVAVAHRGVNVVVDDLILDPAMRTDYLAALADVPTLIVEVRCPPDLLVAREQARGDRSEGMALAFLPLIEAHAPPYDLTVDTSLVTPEDAARAIKDALAERRRAVADPGPGRATAPGSSPYPVASP